MRSKTQSKFLRYIKCPFRALARARDLYMQSLAATGGGCHVTYGNAMGCPTPQISTLPRSLSAGAGYRSGDEQMAELRRSRSGVPAVRRSKTVAHGRIDEEKVFESGDDERMGLLGRSRSYAASTRVKLLL